MREGTGEGAEDTRREGVERGKPRGRPGRETVREWAAERDPQKKEDGAGRRWGVGVREGRERRRKGGGKGRND